MSVAVMPRTEAFMDEEDSVKLGRYLVGELFWELAQHETLTSGFASVQREAVEVLSFRGGSSLRVRVAGDVYDVRLSWQKLVPPLIQKADQSTV